MEIKKGSWKKRFLEIREGSVWICKNDRVSLVISLLSFAPWSTSFFEVGLVLTAFPSFGFGLGVLQGKDEQFLCSMSAYDVYSFTRPYKAPKGRVWGLKSREPLSFYSVSAS